jgi:hypothetical protein
MEYSFKSLDPRDLRGEDINFYLTGKKIDNDLQKNAVFTTSQSVLYNGVRDGVIYRQLIMRKPPNNGIGYIIDLAEIIIPGGIIRVDRSRLAFEYELTLGHFGLPHLDGKKAKVTFLEDDFKKTALASIENRKLALISYNGWDKLENLTHKKRNAESDESTVIYVHKKRLDKNPPMELMITAFLHKTDDNEWAKEELSPIKTIEIFDITKSYSALGATITLSDNKKFKIDFKDIDGYKSC